SAAWILNPFQRLGNAVDHDVGPSALIGRPIAFLHPCSAHTPCVIERQVPIPALTHLPAKDVRVEARRIFGAVGWDLEVTDLSVGHQRILRYRYSPTPC